MGKPQSFVQDRRLSNTGRFHTWEQRDHGEGEAGSRGAGNTRKCLFYPAHTRGTSSRAEGTWIPSDTHGGILENQDNFAEKTLNLKWNTQNWLFLEDLL